jgi:hypothetical protein
MRNKISSRARGVNPGFHQALYAKTAPSKGGVSAVTIGVTFAADVAGVFTAGEIWVGAGGGAGLADFFAITSHYSVNPVFAGLVSCSLSTR